MLVNEDGSNVLFVDFAANLSTRTECCLRSLILGARGLHDRDILRRLVTHYGLGGCERLEGRLEGQRRRETDLVVRQAPPHCVFTAR